MKETLQRSVSVDLKISSKNVILDNLKHNMVLVKGGVLKMGEQLGSYQPKNDVEPVHNAMLLDFYIGKYLVTQTEWREVMGNNPSHFIGDNNPVENVSWNDCYEFISKLNRLTKLKFTFSTEAQWEFAAKGGRHSGKFLYSGSNDLWNVGWCYYNSGDTVKTVVSEGSWLKKPKFRNEIVNNRTHPVDSKNCNELNLYGMSGNVSEWCFDWFAPYSSGFKKDPTGPLDGKYKVCRGGNWQGELILCESINRGSLAPHGVSSTIGLRLAINP